MKSWEKEIAKTGLASEKEVIKELKKTYEQSLKEIEEKIKLLQADELTQSKIYQIEYQKTLKKQVGTILDNLNNHQYDNISDYLKKSYEDGFIGTMYSLQQQGVPLVIPIDQEQVARAIVKDTKLKESLYESLGVNVNTLKKQINSEIARGISTAMSYQDIARNITNKANISLNKSIRIAKTEGHRINQQSTMDGMYAAKDKGADVVKQWDATLDAKTRTSHQMVDGEIRELKDKDGKETTFSNGLRFPGDPQGSAAEVINCRCVLLQRARWALDDDELNTLKERAEYFELYKNDNFKEYKTKYLKNMEENSIIIDDKTPCLIRNSDNKIVDTSVIQVSPTKNEYKDWEFDWTVPEKKGYKVYGVKAHGDNRIQGLIAVKPDYKDFQAMMVDIVESAPFNNPHNKLFKEKEYSGVGGHLFAEAVKQSYENGFDGYVFFQAKSNLIEHYQKSLGAILINPSERTMVIDERGAKVLYDKYYKGK